jgi:hypothetical protein
MSSLEPRGGCLVRGFRRPQPVLGSRRHARGGSVGGFLQERADERETGFVAIVAATGIGKLLGAIVPLWLVFRPHSRAVRARCCCGGRGAIDLIWAYRCRHRFDPRGPGHDEKRDLVRGAAGSNLAAWRDAVPDDGLDVRRRTQAGRIADRPARQRAKGYAREVQIDQSNESTTSAVPRSVAHLRGGRRRPWRQDGRCGEEPEASETKRLTAAHGRDR